MSTEQLSGSSWLGFKVTVCIWVRQCRECCIGWQPVSLNISLVCRGHILSWLPANDVFCLVNQGWDSTWLKSFLALGGFPCRRGQNEARVSTQTYCTVLQPFAGLILTHNFPLGDWKRFSCVGGGQDFCSKLTGTKTWNFSVWQLILQQMTLLRLSSLQLW